MSEAVLLGIIGLFQAIAVAFLKKHANKKEEKTDQIFNKIWHSIEINSTEQAKIKIDINEMKTDLKDIKKNAFKDKLLHQRYMQTLEESISIFDADLSSLKNAAWQKGLNFISFCRFINNSVIGLETSQIMTKEDLKTIAKQNIETVKKAMLLNLDKQFVTYFFDRHKAETDEYLIAINKVIFNDNISIDKRKAKFNKISLKFMSKFINKLFQCHYIYYR